MHWPSYMLPHGPGLPWATKVWASRESLWDEIREHPMGPCHPFLHCKTEAVWDAVFQASFLADLCSLFSNTALEKTVEKRPKSRRKEGEQFCFRHQQLLCPFLPLLPPSLSASQSQSSVAHTFLLCHYRWCCWWACPQCVFCVYIRIENTWMQCSPLTLCPRPGRDRDSAAAAAVLGSSVMLNTFLKSKNHRFFCIPVEYCWRKNIVPMGL